MYKYIDLFNNIFKPVETQIKILISMFIGMIVKGSVQS